jgi:hypothetical protein
VEKSNKSPPGVLGSAFDDGEEELAEEEDKDGEGSGAG